ncbi:MAG: hypothetical protein MUC92_00790 [Fimbriimonadaceae bacterium]|jgi:hypothetical protein|nr:hypothetical protein [Fimbriimonadaceae bacterium]
MPKVAWFAVGGILAVLFATLGIGAWFIFGSDLGFRAPEVRLAQAKESAKSAGLPLTMEEVWKAKSAQKGSNAGPGLMKLIKNPLVEKLPDNVVSSRGLLRGEGIENPRQFKEIWEEAKRLSAMQVLHHPDLHTDDVATNFESETVKRILRISGLLFERGRALAYTRSFEEAEADLRAAWNLMTLLSKVPGVAPVNRSSTRKMSMARRIATMADASQGRPEVVTFFKEVLKKMDVEFAPRESVINYAILDYQYVMTYPFAESFRENLAETGLPFRPADNGSFETSKRNNYATLVLNVYGKMLRQLEQESDPIRLDGYFQTFYSDSVKRFDLDDEWGRELGIAESRDVLLDYLVTESFRRASILGMELLETRLKTGSWPDADQVKTEIDLTTGKRLKFKTEGRELTVWVGGFDRTCNNGYSGDDNEMDKGEDTVLILRSAK